jgi:metal-responsive CopG/Arc/MetJ family transcriptional regulator
MASNTSWQAKAKYNKRYTEPVTAKLNKALVELLEEKLNDDGITKAEFIRRAIKDYLGEE